MNPTLERRWLHVQVHNGNVYVFLDDGHWENSSDPLSREDWVMGTAIPLESLANECMVGSLPTNGGSFRVRIRLNPEIKFGKFGMPYEVR